MSVLREHQPVRSFLEGIETIFNNVTRLRSERDGILRRGDRSITHKPRKLRCKKEKSE
jgi:hypothetical protein